MNRSSSVSHSRSPVPSSSNSRSSSVSVNSEDHSSSESRSASNAEAVTPNGSFSEGLPTEDARPTAAQASMLCPTPVRQIIQGLAALALAGGMGETVYGGINLNYINSTPDPLAHPGRPEQMAHVGVGLMLMTVGFFAFNLSYATRTDGNPQRDVHPA